MISPDGAARNERFLCEIEARLPHGEMGAVPQPT